MAIRRGEYKVVCDSCGAVFLASRTRMRWDNFRVCIQSCYETRNPQDMPPPLIKPKIVPNPRVAPPVINS